MKTKRMIKACLAAVVILMAPVAMSQTIVDMAAAFKKNDSKTLTRLLPSAKGHALEPWAAYWELRARLNEATNAQVEAFYKRYAGTYAEDRLRADWLLLLGARRDWQAFDEHYGSYRMRDDKDIGCYALHIAFLRTGRAEPAQAAHIEQAWMSQKSKNTGCGYVAEALIDAKQLPSLVSWRKSYKGERLDAHATPEQRNWALGFEAKALAQKLDLAALDSFARVTQPADLSADMREWYVRTALRAQDWKTVLRVTSSMPSSEQQNPAWQYWQARAIEALQGAGVAKAQLERLAQDASQSAGFYQQLARERLGLRLNLAATPQPAPITEQEAAAARANAGLARALLAIQIGLRAEGVREWNYEVNLAKGSMSDRERLAASALACSLQVWDRCINTSERTRQEIDWTQRFPMPHQAAVLKEAKHAGVDPAYAYGLMRQESRFIADAASSVGAMGLMQVMPATARWTAKKIGLQGFDVSQMHNTQTNLTIGMAYLAIVLADFDSQAAPALAAAAYNAGPSRARAWRKNMTQNGAIETAIWAENIPFDETRDYVKKVLANASIYAARTAQQGVPVLTLTQRLGLVTMPSVSAAVSSTP